MKAVIKKMQKQNPTSVTIKSDIHKEQIEFEQSDYFKDSYKERYKIEAKIVN